MSPSSAALVLDALWIRRWAIELLARGEATPEVADRVRAGDLAAWRTFLATERCALPLFELSGFQTLLPSLPAPVAAMLDQYRLHEMKRALSVYAQLLDLGETAARERWRVVVLKGGVAIAGKRYLDVQDLDVLALPGEIPALTRFLERSGAAAAESCEDVPIGAPGGFHLRPRRMPHALQVEVHYALKGVGDGTELIARAEPLESMPRLWRLSTSDHLYHLLYHACVHHPGRIGGLRDTLLVTSVLHTAPDACVEAVRARLADLPHPKRLSRLLDFAGSITSGVATPDPFTAVAAANYLLHAHASWGRNIGTLEVSGTALLLQGFAQYADWADELVTGIQGPTTHRILRRLDRWVPFVSGGMRRSRRALTLLSVLPRSLSVARAARRLARRFEAESA